jgi:N-acyl-D-aspartate/D-glutamate deacylase
MSDLRAPVAFLSELTAWREGEHMPDILIRHGTVYDGEGNPPSACDVAIRGELVEALGSLGDLQAPLEIDASGLVVAPGFIDMHSHADLHLLHDPQSTPKLMQGVTTEVIGNCGLSIVPVREEDRDSLRAYLGGILGDYEVAFQGTTMASYLEYMESQGTGVNVVPLMAHGAVRRTVMGLENREPHPSELNAMDRLIDEAMSDGCWGLSTGLAYPPAFFSRKEELTHLCRAVRAHNGLFALHMRSEGNFLLESVDEALSIAREAGVSLEISHLKSYGEKNWHKTEPLLLMIEKAQESGIDISFDSYPYHFGSTTLAALLPPSLFMRGGDLKDLLNDAAQRTLIMDQIATEEPGTENYAALAGWKGILFAGGSSGKNDHLNGLSLNEIAALKGGTPQEALIDLLVDEGGTASMLILGMKEENVEEIARHRLHIFGSDGLYGTRPHPRTYGAFTRAIELFVKRRRAMTLQEALRHMTSGPARKLGLTRRGSIKPGSFADIVIFDLEHLAEHATITDPMHHPTGMEYLFVNGEMMIRKGEVQTLRPGRVLRKKG